MGEIRALMITGHIEGHDSLPEGMKVTKYEEVIPALIEVEENDEIKGLVILINTVGGDVEAGLAISEAISSLKKPTASVVLGGGHSIGVPLAVSVTRSFICPSATMTIHPVRVNGTVPGTYQAFDYLSKMQKRVCDFIIAHSKIDEMTLNKLLYNTGEMSCDIGTILYGKGAVDVGLVDEVGGISNAIEFLKNSELRITN